MLIYGDRVTVEDESAKLAVIGEALSRMAGMPAGIGRHGELVSTFIEAAELLQGVADRDFDNSRHDRLSAAQDAATRLVMRLASAVGRSWTSGFAEFALPPQELVRGMQATARPVTLRIRVAEGYAFYSVYPEAYLEAARRSRLEGSVKVIGIRSIGAGLAAMVATALNATPPVTVRPIGHPFRRELALAPDLVHALGVDPAARYAVVDEGPGLSGSSFGTVADWLESRGVAPGRICFFPSHGGEAGPEASARHRARWTGAQRHVVDLDALVLRAPRPVHRLDHWVQDVVGGIRGPLEDISSGAWRRLHYSSEADWPPAQVQQEKRKFLLHAESGPWLLKFAGLGRSAMTKVALGKGLAEAGFIPKIEVYRHGFTCERWIEDTEPLDPGAIDRDALVRRVGRYLGYRARYLPAERDQGASPPELMTMARRNAALALGEAAARTLDTWATGLDQLARSMRRVRTDNRMHPWEWLQTRPGALLKSDALDHHRAHDLIGCQDVAWDITGAAVELAMTPVEEEALCAIVESESGHGVDRNLLAFFAPCYLAFQVGASTLAADGLAGWPAEQGRLRAAASRYRAGLARHLEIAPVLR